MRSQDLLLSLDLYPTKNVIRSRKINISLINKITTIYTHTFLAGLLIKTHIFFGDTPSHSVNR